MNSSVFRVIGGVRGQSENIVNFRSAASNRTSPGLYHVYARGLRSLNINETANMVVFNITLLTDVFFFIVIGLFNESIIFLMVFFLS